MATAKSSVSSAFAAGDGEAQHGNEPDDKLKGVERDIQVLTAAIRANTYTDTIYDSRDEAKAALKSLQEEKLILLKLELIKQGRGSSGT